VLDHGEAFAHLLACCQRCHMRMDQALHQRHAAETRALARQAGPQLGLFSPH
jgi:hypothetical protein